MLDPPTIKAWMVEYERIVPLSPPDKPCILPTMGEAEEMAKHKRWYPTVYRNVSDPIALYADVEGRIAELEEAIRDFVKWEDEDSTDDIPFGLAPELLRQTEKLAEALKETP